jgi:integrase
VFSLILAATVRSQLLAVNPCAGLMLPSNRRAGDSILTVTRDEFAGKLLPAVRVEHRATVRMAAGCGLRRGECAGLAWDTVDLDRAEAQVRQVVVELSGQLALRPYPKTRAGRRAVPIPASDSHRGRDRRRG